ncbi:alpha/beta fold hydrolase [Paenibacillus sp. FSL R7-0331]|uniref:alpha/beta fold hydrolase n=1 Tax=Paenibacillus sp. FSL R7-0331 TaxID=1536773 RepID=UPI0009DCE8AA|nr:alpha/beta fold hydrolase [Paenibacillus sp. FSL R7-0331]
MRKKAVLISVCGLLLLGTGGVTPPAYGANNRAGITLNNEPFSLPEGMDTFLQGSEIMVPVRPLGEAFGYEVKYIKVQNSLELNGNNHTFVIKLDETTVYVDGEAGQDIFVQPELRNNRIYVPVSFFRVLGLIITNNAGSAQAAVTTPYKYAENITALLSGGKYMELWQQTFSKDVQLALPVLKLQAFWETLTGTHGSFVRLDSVGATQEADYTVIQAPLVFAEARLTMNLKVDSSGRLAGILFGPASTAVELSLPAGLIEEETIVGAGTAYPLEGVLTLPEHSSGPLPSVVLVHGSGSTDRDETALGYKAFRDLAWGLARQGIAVLRYDKRTFTYGQQYAGDKAASLTVKEETVEDAVLAAKLLRQDKRLNPDQVYIAGHSLGGMLAPRIDADGGDFAGLILLAGSPRKLWEIVYDQNMALIRSMNESDPLKAQSAALIDAEAQKVKALASMTAEQAKQAPPVFGMPANYLLEMQHHDTAELARKLTKPVLVLQGADDFQVYADKDYLLWKEVLSNNPSAEFKLYPGLNHFFVNYDGAGAGTTDEYNVPGVVDEQVISDIGGWISKYNNKN